MICWRMIVPALAPTLAQVHPLLFEDAGFRITECARQTSVMISARGSSRQFIWGKS